MRTRPNASVLAGVAAVAVAVFVVMTVIVTSSQSLGLDSHAFTVAHELRTGWLDSAARAVTALGLLAIVGPALLAGSALLVRRRYRRRSASLVAGALITWVCVWVTKALVDRPRPPEPLVHTAGQSYPSGHAANSVGWLALAIAVAVLIPRRGWRAAAITSGAVLALLVGLSRIYLRAHYASDVIGGEALAVAVYAGTAATALAWRREIDPLRDGVRGSTDAGLRERRATDNGERV